MFRVNYLFFAVFLCGPLQAASFQWLVEDINEEFKDRIAGCGLEVAHRDTLTFVPQRETTGVIAKHGSYDSYPIAYLAKFIGSPTIYRIQNRALQNRYDVDVSQFRIRFSTNYLGTVARAVSLTKGKTTRGFTKDYTHFFCGSERVRYGDFRACLEENYLGPLIAQLCRA